MPELASPLTPRRVAPAQAAPEIDIVVPVYNEAAGLEQSIRRLHRFLSDGFPFNYVLHARRVGECPASLRPRLTNRG